MIRLLFIEDNADLAYAIGATLSILGNYEVTHAVDGEKGLELYNKVKPHVVVSDVEMPIMNGFELARSIRHINKDCVIILATALSSTEDVLTGFEIGIDEYIKKPYSAPELHARIQAILRRLDTSTLTNETDTIILIGKYQLDTKSKFLYFDKEKTKLTPKEYNVLEFLLRNKNNTISREELTESLWGGSDFFSSRSLDVFISKLRKYLSQDKNIKITTIRGEGIRFELNK